MFIAQCLNNGDGVDHVIVGHNDREKRRAISFAVEIDEGQPVIAKPGESALKVHSGQTLKRDFRRSLSIAGDRDVGIDAERVSTQLLEQGRAAPGFLKRILVPPLPVLKPNEEPFSFLSIQVPVPETLPKRSRVAFPPARFRR
ncbi:MAG: hypothetical protein M3O21_05050 [Chloroflexota bacterium]|nr:hypothetical protein [Chloroflexota bacterium]